MSRTLHVFWNSSLVGEFIVEEIVRVVEHRLQKTHSLVA